MPVSATAQEAGQPSTVTRTVQMVVNGRPVAAEVEPRITAAQ